MLGREAFRPLGKGPSSLSELRAAGGPGLLFHFLGSVFGTEGWHRPQRAADSHLRERQIKKALSVNKTRPSFPRAGEGRRSPPGERRGKPTACPRRREEREEGFCSIQSCSRAIMAAVEKFQHVLQGGGKGPKGRTPAFPKHHRVLPQVPGLCTDRSLLWPLHQPLTAAPARLAALVALLTKLLRAASGPSWWWLGKNWVSCSVELRPGSMTSLHPCVLNPAPTKPA